MRARVGHASMYFGMLSIFVRLLRSGLTEAFAYGLALRSAAGSTQLGWCVAVIFVSLSKDGDLKSYNIKSIHFMAESLTSDSTPFLNLQLEKMSA